MTNDTLFNALSWCRQRLGDGFTIVSARLSEAQLSRSITAMGWIEQKSHMAWMTEEAMRLAVSGEREKAMRWLGFIQGFLWGHDMASIAELREANRGAENEHHVAN